MLFERRMGLVMDGVLTDRVGQGRKGFWGGLGWLTLHPRRRDENKEEEADNISNLQ